MKKWDVTNFLFEVQEMNDYLIGGWILKNGDERGDTQKNGHTNT